MAAPLPSGLNVSVVPQAPQVDPRMFAGDPQGALASMQAGLLLSQELASLENKKAQRALEAEKIKLDMQRNKLERMYADEAIAQAPAMVGQLVGGALARQAAETELARRNATASLAAGLPEAVAGQQLAGAQAQTAASQVARAKASFEGRVLENFYGGDEALRLGQNALRTSMVVAGRTPEEQKRLDVSAGVLGQFDAFKDPSILSPANGDLAARWRQRLESELTGESANNQAIGQQALQFGINPFGSDFRRSDGTVDWGAVQNEVSTSLKQQKLQQTGQAFDKKQLDALRGVYANADALRASALSRKEGGFMGTGAVVGNVAAALNKWFGTDIGEAASRSAGNALALAGLVNSLVDADFIGPGQAKAVLSQIPTDFGNTESNYVGKLDEARKSLLGILTNAAEINAARFENTPGSKELFNGIIGKLSVPVGTVSAITRGKEKRSGTAQVGEAATSPGIKVLPSDPTKRVIVNTKTGKRYAIPVDQKLTAKQMASGWQEAP